MKLNQHSGTLTIERMLKININVLQTNGYVREGAINEGTFQNNEYETLFHIHSDCSSAERRITIKYQEPNGSAIIEQVLRIEAIKSNLGKGYNLYFICQASGLRCKIMYFDPAVNLLVCRKAFTKRIYYLTETLKKRDRLFAYSETNQKKLFKAFLQVKKKGFKDGQPILFQKIKRLEDRKILLGRLLHEFHESNSIQN